MCRGKRTHRHGLGRLRLLQAAVSKPASTLSRVIGGAITCLMRKTAASDFDPELLLTHLSALGTVHRAEHYKC